MSLQNNKHKIFLSLAAILILSAGFFSYPYIISSFYRVTTDDAYITGRIHSVSSKIPGTVQKIYIDDNQRIKKGELLVEIDPIDYVLKANEAKAILEIRVATLEQATRDKIRAEALYTEKVYPKEKYEHAVTDYNLAQAQEKAAREQLKIAQMNMTYTKIHSASDGLITQKSVETGNQIQAHQPLMAVVALDDIWLQANYKETQLKKVRPGQRVEIKVDTYPGKIFTGKVDSIMAGTGAAFSLFPQENALGNYVKVVQRIPVKIIFDKITDENHVLRVGMSCIPTIITQDE